MFKDPLERKSYRKSPGRQYGYAYNPLHDQNRPEISASDETWSGAGEVSRVSRPSGVLSPRPDPRRTRQLMRQHILAGKSHAAVLENPRDLLDDVDAEDELVSTPSRAEQRLSVAPVRGYQPERYQEFAEEQGATHWMKQRERMPAYLDADPEDDTRDPLEERVHQIQPRQPASTPPTRILSEKEEDELVAEELRERKRRDARRKFLLSALVIGGAGVAAYEILPRLPQAISAGASNLEHQLQQAFQSGVTAGGDAARKDLINALDSLEGFSLEGAIEAAKLTRVAYGVFISPLVTLASEVADDFLAGTLDALITGRKWLAQINEDSPTLAALQAVLQNWVDQVHNMPKTVQTITETDLDGAQSYLRALQRKIQTEQAQLNAPTTPTPATHNTPPKP
ncbi:MAG: hypothetical protein ACRDHZ_12080 [Ktedonobacteraceae bacterium]